jgi:hypothetical protein
MAFAKITREELKSSLKKTVPVSSELNNIKLLFVPTHIDPDNPEELTSIYKNVCSSNFDTLVVKEAQYTIKPFFYNPIWGSFG